MKKYLMSLNYAKQSGPQLQMRTSTKSLAGKYLSFLNINPQNQELVKDI